MSDRALAIAMGLHGKSSYFKKDQDNTVMALVQRAGKMWGINISNINGAEDHFLQLFDEVPDKLTIEEITDGGGGTVNIKITGHDRSTGDLAIFAGTTSYNNVDAQIPVAITKVDADNFTIVATYVADETAGTAFFPNVILGTTTPKKSLMIPAGDGLQHGVLDNIKSGVPIEFDNEVVFAITKTHTGSGAPTIGDVCNIDYR